jgi:2-polyprenyl-6-methoxyphenol hydroxylase-like FAD-dependent oxidoreductase
MSNAIVIGGGIGGMAAGAALVNAGLEAVVYEQASELREIGAGVGLQIRAVKALRAIGLFDEVLEIGHRLERLEIRAWTGRRLASIPVGDIGRELGADSLVVHRAELLDVLSRRLVEDGRVVLGARCVGCEQELGRATASFSDGREERGAVLIGADGVHSTIRTRVVGDTVLRQPGFSAWRAMPEYAHDAVADGVAHILIGRGRLFGLFPGSRGRTFWFGSGLPLDGGAAGRDRWKAEALREYDGWYEPVQAAIEATDATQIHRHPLLDRKPLERWGHGRITLLGDAAHPMLPTLGQGAGQAIEDGVALAARLQAADLGSARRTSDALRAYEAQRIPPTAAMVDESWSLGMTYHWRSRVACWVRDAGFRGVPDRLWRRRSAAGMV